MGSNMKPGMGPSQQNAEALNAKLKRDMSEQAKSTHRQFFESLERVLSCWSEPSGEGKGFSMPE